MPSASERPAPPTGWNSSQSAVTRLMLVLILVITPWLLGATRPLPIVLLICSIAFLTLVWLWDCVAHDRLHFHICHTTLGLVSVLALGLIQLIPMPRWLLRLLSPGTSSLYEELLPQQHETLNIATATEYWGDGLGQTLSLYPEATRRWLVYLLAVVLLFQVLRHSLRGVAGAQWYARICVVNGTMLSIFAVVQFFTSPPNVLYWTFRTEGTGFGPFVNRDDFAFYINVCLGPAFALLLARLRHLFASRQKLVHLNFRSASRVIVGDARTMWLLFSTAFMMAASISANSRGGFLSLLCGLILLVATLLWKWKYSAEIHNRRLRSVKAGSSTGGLDVPAFRRSGASLSVNSALLLVLVICSMAGTLVVWYGWDRVQARLETLISGTAFQGGRMYVLQHAWSPISQFPIFGTGMGTFEHIEPIYFHTANDVSSFYMHAHNDYLEDLIEGGLLRLAFRLVVLSVLFRSCFRMIGNSRNLTRSSLAAGFLLSLTTITVHSLFDYALFTPAITVLAIAQLAAITCLASLSETSDEHGMNYLPTTGKIQFSPHGGYRIVVLVLAGLLVISMVRKATQEYRARRIASSIDTTQRYSNASSTMTSNRVKAFNRLLLEIPNDAKLHSDIADFYLAAYESSRVDQMDSVPNGPDGSVRLTTLATGLKHALRARDLCPIIPEPHVKLAIFHSHLVTSDLKSTYLARAKLIAPASEELWYLCGTEELQNGQIHEALTSWRHCISLGDQFRQQIAKDARDKLTHKQIQRMLPDAPQIILSMADLIYPPGDREFALERRDLFVQAFQRLPDVTPYTSTSNLLDHYAIRYGVGQFEEADKILELLLRRNPENHDARMKRFRLLIEQDRLTEAREQLTILKAMHVSNSQIEQLSRELTSKEIERRSRNRRRPQ